MTSPKIWSMTQPASWSCETVAVTSATLHPWSKASHNPEGTTEARLKHQRKEDKAICGWFKKRHRKDLDADEIEAIVSAAKIPNKLHKDIA